ncbi:hypothetical protein O988_05974, partial [Pseudogymnoascus sp. VKM F-3808]
NAILKSLISESTPPTATQPAFKFAVNSTIIQHLVPTTALNKSSGGAAAEGGASAEQAGRRGMNSATGAYWNEATDGMWSFKFEGGRGLDVVISVIWVGLNDDPVTPHHIHSIAPPPPSGDAGNPRSHLHRLLPRGCRQCTQSFLSSSKSAHYNLPFPSHPSAG